MHFLLGRSLGAGDWGHTETPMVKIHDAILGCDLVQFQVIARTNPPRSFPLSVKTPAETLPTFRIGRVIFIFNEVEVLSCCLAIEGAPSVQKVVHNIQCLFVWAWWRPCYSDTHYVLPLIMKITSHDL